MKFKKILSALISVSMMAATVSFPALADYDTTGSEYDVVIDDVNFNDNGATTNDIDGTKAYQHTGSTEEVAYTTSNDAIFPAGFFMSFDFRFDTVDGKADGTIRFSNKDNKTGPFFSFNGTQLRTQTGGSSYQELGEISADTWYTAEIEGTMTATTSHADFRLYKYSNGQKELLNEQKDFNLRNFANDTNKLMGNFKVIGGISLDNINVIAKNPNRIEITSSEDELTAGQSMPMSRMMFRDDAEWYNHSVTWSVYDENNTEALSETSGIAINENGVLMAGISAKTQVVTVRASAEFGENTLVGIKKIAINAIDVSDEKFDTITISGNDTVKAGTETKYTFMALKNGSDVTDTLTDEDVVWSIYDYANLNPIYENDNSSKKVSVENGTLTIFDDVIPQDITIRASTPSGKVYDKKTVKIEFSDIISEKGDIYYNAFESNRPGENDAMSVDGSMAYLVTTQDDLWSIANHGEYLLTEMDIKFTANGAGFALMRRDGAKTNTTITYNDGKISANKDVIVTSADADAWYHIEVLYSNINSNASCNVYAYNADGTLGEPIHFLDIARGDGTDFGRLRIYAGTCIDNVKISTPAANEITLKAANNKIYSGASNQITATLAKNGLPILGEPELEWTLIDSNGKYILDGPVKINNSGLLTTTQATPTQTVKVQVRSGNYTNTVSIDIELLEPFEIINIGKNEAGNKIVKLFVNKKSGYNDDVIFMIAIYDEKHILKGFSSVATEGKSYAQGENEINFDMDLTKFNFDPEKDIIKTFIWTRF